MKVISRTVFSQPIEKNEGTQADQCGNLCPMEDWALWILNKRASGHMQMAD